MEARAPMNGRGMFESLTLRFPIDFDRLVDQVDDPVFGNAGARVGCEFDCPIVL